MTTRRRTALLEFALTHGAVIIEDDYDGEFRLGARPLDALQTLDRSESVFYVGTFSKSLFPEMRLGFVVPPPWARPALVAAKQCTTGTGGPEQETLAPSIAEGHLAVCGRCGPRCSPPNAAQLPVRYFHAGWSHPLPLIAPGGAETPVDATHWRLSPRHEGIGIYSLQEFISAGPSG
jgi:hypothetical protein